MSLGLLPADTQPNDEGIAPEEFRQLEQDTTQSPNDIGKWDELFAKIDERLALVNPKDISIDFKQFIHRSYTRVLNRFPYLNEYWRRFLVLEYKLNGILGSIGILSRSVDACQFSIDLWDDYLNALMLEKHQDYGPMLELCIELNGYHFNSQSIWDKYLEYLRLQKQPLLEVYLKLIRIPLYDYAKYYNQFVEINKDYDLTAILGDDLQVYLEKFGKIDVNECSVIETHQIIDDFCYDIFTTTQAQVTRKWDFESKITKTELDLHKLDDDQLDIWISYLNNEIENLDYKSASNVFERALMVHCFDGKLWLKYLAFANSLEVDKFDIMDSIYNRCTQKFIPLDQNTIRFSYSKFLIKFGKLAQLNDYLLDMIKYFGDSLTYHKQEYVDTIETLLTNWQRISLDGTLKILENYLECFFEQGKPFETELAGISADTLNLLYNRLNDHGILVIMKVYLYAKLETLNQKSGEDVDKFREFFQKYYDRSQISSSVSFWKFWVEFEGICMFNFKNLHQIIEFVKAKTTLPVHVINSFLSLQYNLYTANFAKFKSEVDSDAIINYHNDISTSLVRNTQLLKSHQKTIRELKSQFEHPGIIVDNKPDISNTLLRQNFDIFSDEIPYPAITRTDRANTPIPYPE